MNKRNSKSFAFLSRLLSFDTRCCRTQYFLTFVLMARAEIAEIPAVIVNAIMGTGCSIYAKRGDEAVNVLAKKLQKPIDVVAKRVGNTLV